MPKEKPVAPVSKAGGPAPENVMVSDDDFFAALHQSLTSPPVVSAQAQKANDPNDLAAAFAGMETPPAPKQPEPKADDDDLELDKDTLEVIKEKYKLVDKQDYSASSREAIRLNEELKKVEPYKELLGTIASDGNLQEMIFNYLHSGGQVPDQTADKLNLPEDFIFDPDEALKNPNSDSAKALNGLIEKSANRIADAKFNKYMQEQEKKSTAAERNTQRRLFMQENKLDEDQMAEFENWMKSTDLTLGMFYNIYQGKDRDKKIAANAVKNKINRLKQNSDMPASLAGAGETGEEKASVEDQLFDAIIGKTLPMNNIFK